MSNGEVQRNADGTFAVGNPGGPGNPHAAQVAQLRRELMNTVTPEDLKAVVRMLIDKAKDGDLAAARELLDRTLGKPASSVEVTAKAAPPLDHRHAFSDFSPDRARELLEFARDCVPLGDDDGADRG